MIANLDYDVIIIGAGMSGIYALYKMRELDMRVRVLEAASEVGGTWYWNRYPGARFDSESYSYGYSFSKELLDEWDWSEHFAAQPETNRYINYVCDKFDLRRDMEFNCTIKRAKFQESTRSWTLTTEAGENYTTRFLITAIGLLSTPTLPKIPGISDYKGDAFHTARWPKEKVNFEGKRVGIIGTGATAIQIIQEISKNIGHLTVFQRTPNWAAPSGNAKISQEEMEGIRKNYPQIFQKCWDSPSSFLHAPDSRSVFDVTSEEREAVWNRLFNGRGFAMWQGSFKDTYTDKKANDLLTDFMARKIRQRVNDPETAEKLIPKNHGFGTRRVPGEVNYFEVYNQSNVRLVDLIETPIERITERGLKTSEEDFELDAIIYATGFDAVTGAFDEIDFEGVNGVKLNEKWRGGPKTYLGMTVDDLPNMFMSMGPHQAYGNIPRSIEYAVEWISNLIKHCCEHNVTWVEATKEGVQWWTNHVITTAEGLLMNEVDSWMTGVNKNVEGKQTRIIARYSAGAPTFRKHCHDVEADHYKTMILK